MQMHQILRLPSLQYVARLLIGTILVVGLFCLTPVVLNACAPSTCTSMRQTRQVGIPVSIRRVRIEMEPSRQRFTPSRSMYMVGEYGTGGAWRKTSQSTRSPICFVVLIISVLMSLILNLEGMALQNTVGVRREFDSVTIRSVGLEGDDDSEWAKPAT